jgi:hypothetical protein
MDSAPESPSLSSDGFPSTTAELYHAKLKAQKRASYRRNDKRQRKATRSPTPTPSPPLQDPSPGPLQTLLLLQRLRSPPGLFRSEDSAISMTTELLQGTPLDPPVTSLQKVDLGPLRKKICLSLPSSNSLGEESESTTGRAWEGKYLLFSN